MIFTPGKETVLKSYTLTTGADTGSENRHYRNWKDWILYGSNTPNDDASWTPIQAINSANLPTTDHTISRDFVVAAHAPYTHFKLVITAIESGGTQQMAELTATGSTFQNSVCQCGFTCQNHEYWDYACKTCGKACPHANGYTGGYCKDCGMLHDHTGETFENGAYTECGYACSHTGVLSLHFVEGTGHNPWLLLDGRSDTFWWSKHPMHGEEYVIFVSSAPAVFSSYTLTANKNFPKESLWTSWTLYGSYNKDKNWTVIHQVEDTSLELDENFVSQTFTVEPHIPYPYYKLDLYEIESDYWETEQNMSEITITGLRLENNTCVRCGFHCTEHSYKDGFCEDCIQEHDHSGETFTGGKGDSCGYVCPHLQYDDAYKCSLCKLACAHKFNGNTCEDCGFVCGHSVGYEKGNCKLCGTEHDHTDEGYTNGAHTICHKPCHHVEYNKETHKCTVCQMACSHEKGHTKGVCNACETDCDHTSGYSATGFCNTCEYYEPAPQNNDGVHQISNAGQLYWFAEQINSGSPSISAELTCNIDVSNAPTNGIWTPIAASEGYTGTLDGKGYTVDGIVVENDIGSGFYAHLSEGGVIKNLGLGPSCTVTGFDETGGICGVNRGTIDCCWYLGTVGPPLNYYHGAVDGIAGRNFGTIKNCWFNGKSNNNYVDGICKSTDNFPRNCYFGINGSNGSFATGEIAFKLQASMNITELVWGQNLDNGNPKDANPVLNGPQVYQVTDCQGNTYYSNSSSNGGHQFGSDGKCVCGAECPHEETVRIIDDSSTHSDLCTICDYVTATEPHAFDLLTGLCDCGAKCTHNFENGTCANCQNVCTHDLINSKGKCPCGAYYPAKLVEDVYQIENNQQLHWFAMKVNAGFNTISGKLMKDIAVTGVWTPMNAYCGTFDGNGKTITGLYNLDSSKSNVGFFGTVEASGTVKNLRVKDAHFLGRLFVGAIAGQNKGTILNCAASATLSANTYIGGLVGQVLEGGSIANCYSTATVSATRDPGGIAGKITDNSTVTNCYYLSDADQSEAKTQAQFASGEVAYLLQGDQTGRVWGQTIGTETVPVLNGKMVYTTTGCPSGYTNTEGEEKDHTYIDGKCACGETVQGLTIIQQPTNGEAKLGERYCVEVQAVGEGLQYQWYMKNAGSKSFAKSSVTDNTYDDVMTKARADREVYCVITDAHGNKVTTDTVKLICLPGEDLAITRQPKNASAKLNETFCVTVEAKGDGLKYQWYWRNADSENWNVSGQKDNTYDDVMTSARHNREVKCVITDGWGNTVETEIATITGIPTVTLAITRQPANQTVALGENFNVTFEAVGDGLKYQWYFRPVGTETWHTSAQKDNSYDDEMTEARHNRELYCVVTDAWGNKVATEPIVTIMASHQYDLAITSQPENASAKLGEQFCVTVEAEGDGLKYQWYWRNVGNERWNTSGQRDNTYDDVMTRERSNREVKCVITDLWGDRIESDSAIITGIPNVPLAITKQPTDGAAPMGKRYCVTVEAQGDNLTYTWYFQNPGSKSWSKSGVTDNTYDDVMTKARANRQVYCVITDALGNQVTTNTVTLNVIK